MNEPESLPPSSASGVSDELVTLGRGAMQRIEALLAMHRTDDPIRVRRATLLEIRADIAALLAWQQPVIPSPASTPLRCAHCSEPRFKHYGKGEFCDPDMRFGDRRWHPAPPDARAPEGPNIRFMTEGEARERGILVTARPTLPEPSRALGALSPEADRRMVELAYGEDEGVYSEIAKEVVRLRAALSTKDAEIARLTARLVKVDERRQNAKDREDVLTGLAAKFAVVHEAARQRFSVDGVHWASTPAKAVRAYIDFVTVTPPSEPDHAD